MGPARYARARWDTLPACTSAVYLTAGLHQLLFMYDVAVTLSLSQRSHCQPGIVPGTAVLARYRCAL